MAPGVWLDFAHKPANSYIGKAEIEAQLAEHGLTLKPGSVFLYHTGWYRKFDTAPFEYIRDYPGLDGEAAHWLADSGVVCVGADAPSVDSFNEVAVRMIQPVHMLALGALGTCVANILTTIAAGRFGATTASIAGFFIPVVALLLGVAVRGERVAAISLVGGAISLGAAWVVRWASLRAAVATAVPVPAPAE